MAEYDMNTDARLAIRDNVNSISRAVSRMDTYEAESAAEMKGFVNSTVDAIDRDLERINEILENSK